jgi:hypothetical protein
LITPANSHLVASPPILRLATNLGNMKGRETWLDQYFGYSAMGALSFAASDFRSTHPFHVVCQEPNVQESLYWTNCAAPYMSLQKFTPILLPTISVQPGTLVNVPRSLVRPSRAWQGVITLSTSPALATSRLLSSSGLPLRVASLGS